MSTVTDLLVVGAVGVGAWWLYNNSQGFKSSIDITTKVVADPIQIAMPTTSIDEGAQIIKDDHAAVIDSINKATGSSLTPLPDAVTKTVGTIEAAKFGVLPGTEVPGLIKEALVPAVTPAVERELDKGVVGIAKDYVDAANPVKQLTNLAGEVGGLIDDVINGRWKWTGLHF